MKRITWEQVKDEANVRGQALKEIMALHKPEQIFDDWYCTHCLAVVREYEIDQAPYPCETIQIIHNTIGSEDR